MLARTELSSYQQQVLMVIIRMTFGWHKKTDRIANVQIRNATGIKDRRNIDRTARTLAARKIIVVCRDDKKAPRYGINTNFADWQLSSIKTPPANACSRQTHVVAKDAMLSSVDTAQVSSLETTEPPSVETQSKYIRKESKQMKDTDALYASSSSSFYSRTEDSSPNCATEQRSALGEYLEWRAKNHEDIPFQKWMNKYG